MKIYTKSFFYTIFIVSICKNSFGGCPQSRPLEEQDRSSLPSKREIPLQFQKKVVLKKMKEIAKQDPQTFSLLDKCTVDIAASYGDPTAQHILNTYYNSFKNSNASTHESARLFIEFLVKKEILGE